jgi:hypothetical protein
VKEIAQLIVDLNGVPMDEFTVHRSPAGRLYYKIEYEVAISVQSSLEYTLLVNGEKLGSVTARYE